MTIPPDSITAFKAQALSFVINSSASARNDGAWDGLFQMLVAAGSSDATLLTPSVGASSSVVNVKGLSATGRNTALADADSAYRMMSTINNMEIVFKAQYWELSQMKADVSQLQDAGKNLAGISSSTGNDSTKLRLLGFVGQYNNWVRRFAPDTQQGGLLAGTQAAEASQYELEQNLKNRFFGAGDGVQGMGDLGLMIDPVTHLASLDTARLESMQASNRQGVVNTVQTFGENFAKSAGLLVSDGNFFSKQLGNLDRGIHYIEDNTAALQQEFGTGDAAHPGGQVAAAWADYNRMKKT
ncbi:hypothetical protein [Gallionella capsiferriformans]|uniref:Flagellar hook-associated protein 2 C-terminal domain-containing protein n=1 Tax=Gallionella capsiferriformans (strain ES-2) TaxID=395494 RepID=D9SGE2_GALCS|nr:hypothetical protein [Gallionella capsiferriformans]ADL55589.1 hypothetical protein Galf_1571 [Gallionella capsiferriformans ES-2]